MLLGPPGFNCCFFFFFAPELESYLAPRDFHRRAAYSICESSFLFIMVFIMIYLFVHDDRDSPRGPNNWVKN